MKIIVLSVASYKEKDGIINAVTTEGVTTFTVKGIKDIKSKNAALNNPMTIAEVESTDGRYRYPLIKSSTILHSPMPTNADLLYYTCLSFLAEITNKMMNDDEKVMMFKHLEAAIEALDRNREPWMTLLIFISNAIKATGHEFDANQCVFCGTRQDIRAFSFKEGGFICQKCYKSEMGSDLSKEQMLLFRTAFLSPDYAHYSEYCNKANALEILVKLNDYIRDNYGVTIEAIKTLNSFKEE